MGCFGTKTMALAVLTAAMATGCGGVIHEYVGPSALAASGSRRTTTAVPSGTRVRLVIPGGLSSQTRFDDDEAYVFVAYDVMVGPEVVLRAGTPVYAHATRQSRRRFGRGGHVEVTAATTTDVYGDVVPLVATPVAHHGGRRVGAAVTPSILLMPIMGPFAWFFWCIRGRPAQIPPGTEFDAAVL